MGALDKQEGGSHYLQFKIQPIDFIQHNSLNFCQGNIIKYVTRYKEKNGIEDLKKAIHYLEILIEYETRRENETGTKTGQARKEADRHL
jgi:Protein of unknwon function (DUF3310)